MPPPTSRCHVDTELQSTVHSVLTSVGSVTGAVRPPSALVAEVESALRRRNLFNGKLAELIGRLKKAAPPLPIPLPRPHVDGVVSTQQPVPLSRRLSRQTSEALSLPSSSNQGPREVCEQLNASILSSLRYRSRVARET